MPIVGNDSIKIRKIRIVIEFVPREDQCGRRNPPFWPYRAKILRSLTENWSDLKITFKAFPDFKISILAWAPVEVY